MRSIVMAFVVVVVFTLTSNSASACTCLTGKLLDADGKPIKLGPGLVRKALKDFTGAIFVGKVIKIEQVKVRQFDEKKSKKKVTVAVELAWAGVHDSTFVIYTNPNASGDSADCGVPYKKNGRYLFDAASVGGLLETTICNPWSDEDPSINGLIEVLGDGRNFRNAPQPD